jgi:hypothetical protein
VTAKELIKELEKLPGDRRVLVDGYEEGYDPLRINTRQVSRITSDAWWAGEWGLDDAGETVTVLGRTKEPLPA